MNNFNASFFLCIKTRKVHGPAALVGFARFDTKTHAHRPIDQCPPELSSFVLLYSPEEDEKKNVFLFGLIVVVVTGPISRLKMIDFPRIFRLGYSSLL